MAESERDLAKIAATYDMCLEYYPDSAAVQIAYLRHYLSPELFSTAVAKFNQFLKTNAQSVELWRYYWDCFRKNPRKDPDIVKQIHHTYEIALNKVGWDKDSGEIWKGHIQFLKERSDWDENTRRDALRKVYHRAVQIPIDNVESLWQELEAFENGINRTIAKKHMSDLSPAHTQARSILRQMQNKYLPPLHLPQSLWNPPPPPTASSPSPSAPSLYLPVHPTFSPEDRTLIGNWKAYLKWEESNPLELEDKTALNNRILGIYKKALGRMRFYPEIWFLAFIWAKGVGKADEAKRFLEEGLRANPKSCLLSYAQAEQLELKKDYPAVHALFQKLLSLLRDELNDLHNQLNPPSAPSSQEADFDPDESQMTVIVPPDNATQVALEKEIKDRKAEYGSVWIMYIRFGRRSEGLASSRSLFREARKEKWTPWTVYEASAMWEYRNADRPAHQSKLEIPINIFERGMNLFGTDADFVKVYLTFLISVDDEKNARALFERTISTYTGDQAKPLWETWTNYEYQYGDLESALKLEQRLAEATNYPPIKRFAKRYTDSRGTDPIAERDLGWEKFKQSSRSSSGFLNGNSQSQLINNGSQQSTANVNHTSSQSLHGGGGKRGVSPDGHRGGKRDAGDRDHPGHGPNKRARGSSPSRERERERERDRDRDRDRGDRERPGWERRRSPPPPPPQRRFERDVPEEKVVALPQSLASFMAQMPGKDSFDGPVFDTEDLLNLFRSAVIPATTGAARPRSPPPARGTRPPPDYGPYQGPGGGGAGAGGKRWGY